MIDFHAHLDLYPDPHATARECIARELYVLSVTTTPSAWAGTAALTEGAPRIRTALGLHPQIAHERIAELPEFERLLPEVCYVGEIGLDGGPEYRRFWPDQQRAFTRILELCELAGGRIMTVHSRRAGSAVLDALEARPGAGTAILHWFSGSQRELARAAGMGCWFSVGPAMLVGAKGRSLAASMPRDRVLTESDGPFAQINGRSAWPWDAGMAVEMLAELWSESAGDVQRQLINNLRALTAKAA
ncbi:Qat anti-phage system TatD family nuclease QatD [Methylocystis sp. IM4]|uniref:Qat anti-phage system TatD family nuclease QatD n=1 Tax=Methylocystis sp. IM4 TaxID=3136560 RepID=UPI00311A6567